MYYKVRPVAFLVLRCFACQVVNTERVCTPNCPSLVLAGIGPASALP